MPPFSQVLFAFAAFFAFYNAVSACLNRRDGGRRSYVLFAGLFFFVPAMLHWHGAPKWVWLLALSDIGTVRVLRHLPFWAAEIWQTGRFARHAVYANAQQRLVLYRMGKTCRFEWDWTADTAPPNSLAGMSGFCRMDGDTLCLCSEPGSEPFLTARQEGGGLVFSLQAGEACAPFRGVRLERVGKNGCPR